MTVGSDALASLEQDADRLRTARAADVSEAVAELVAMPSIRRRIAVLGEWWVTYRQATSRLLHVVARDVDLAAKLASTVLACDVLDDDDIDDVLAAAFPRLSNAFGAVAGERPGVRNRLGMPALPVTRVEPGWLWPVGRCFPDADTIEGVQARLNFLGFPAGPVDGEWTERTQHAFSSWQARNGFEPNGELGDDEVEHLRLTTPEAPE